MGSATQVELLVRRLKKLCIVWFVQGGVLIRSLPLAVLTRQLAVLVRASIVINGLSVLRT